MVFQKRNDDHGRHGTQDLGKSLHKEVDLAAKVTRDRAPDHTDDEVRERNDRCENERESGAVGKAGKDIFTCPCCRQRERERE